MSRVRVPQHDSLNLGLGILRHLVGNATSRGVTQIAREMGLAVSTTHDLLQLMRGLGFVVQEPSNHRYRISPRFFDFIGPFASRFGIVPQIQGFIREQAARGATLSLSVLGGKYTYVVCAQGKLGGTVALGWRGLSYASSCGKVLIARLPRSRWRSYAPNARTPKLTPYTNIDPVIFREQLERARIEGVAFDEEESMLDTCSAAIPLAIPGTTFEYALALVYSLREWSALSPEERSEQVRQVGCDLTDMLTIAHA